MTDLELRNYDADLFSQDMRSEFNLSQKTINDLWILLSTNTINDCIKKVNDSNINIVLQKCAFKGERFLVFRKPSTKVTADNLYELFYIKYSNSNTKLDLRHYSFIKNWDTSKNVEDYCGLI